VNSAVADLAGLAYDSVPSVDILLHFTRTERRLRRSLIKGGTIFGILVGFVFPVIPKV